MALIAMGEAGIPSRVLRRLIGSCWTYAGDGVAPGQISAARMLHEFRFRRIRAGTAIYGVVGRPVSHSVSPAMHNAAFRATASRCRVSAARRRRLRRFHDVCRCHGAARRERHRAVQGATRSSAPTSAIPSAGESSRSTRCAATARGGSAATPMSPASWRRSKASMHLRGARATVLGAGGAARAVAVALASAGMRVTIAARRPDQAQAVAALTGAAIGPWPPDPASWDLLVNATPVGTAPRSDESPLPGGYLFTAASSSTTWSTTRRKRSCSPARPTAGCRTIGGLDMLVAQAQAQFEWWTGQRACRSRHARRRDGATAPIDETCRASKAAGSTQRTDLETDDVRRVRGPGQARDVRAGGEGAGRRSADAGVGVSQGRRALRLRVPARKRRGRRARRPLFVPRQGSVPDPARPQRADDDRAGRRHDRRRQAVHRDAARADERLPVAVRARPAALHRRRRRLSRLRHRGVVRARPPPAQDGAAAERRRRRLHAVRHRAGVRSRAASHSADRQRAHLAATRICDRSISSRARRSNFSSASSNARCR